MLIPFKGLFRQRTPVTAIGGESFFSALQLKRLRPALRAVSRISTRKTLRTTDERMASGLKRGSIKRHELPFERVTAAEHKRFHDLRCCKVQGHLMFGRK